VCGLKSAGVSGTIKHYAANDQETARFDVDSIMSERALREVHIKPFEMAVKLGGATTIMTSYNPINGHWGASNYDLNTTILRGEWG
ncbi:glycoside hydrolase family 3 N-terminal domain-containing protein, partial [Vibrio alfacsensis]